MDKKKMAIILNAAAGTQETEPLFQQIKEICREFSMDVTFFLVHSGADIQQITKKVLGKEYAVMVAAGGDGTISAVAKELTGTSAILGIIPLGTRNHFAKDIQTPLDLREAIYVLSHGEVMTIDTASVNDQFFINNSSIGLYPKIVKHRDIFQKDGFYKWFALIWAFLLVVSKNSFLNIHIVSSEKGIDYKTPIFFIGNNRYSMQGYELGSRESLTRGKLFLSLMCRTSRLRLLRIIAQAILGSPPKYADFDIWESQEVIVYSENKFLQVALDGEIVPLQAPLRYLIHPRSLHVIVSQKYAHNHSHR
ncbi:MAG TPA: diacylglycerol kinase family protein [Patescibacteria group bacterium]